MYGNPAGTLAATGASGAVVGGMSGVVWMSLAGFALLATGLALYRIVPRLRRSRR